MLVIINIMKLFYTLFDYFGLNIFTTGKNLAPNHSSFVVIVVLAAVENTPQIILRNGT